MLVGVPSVGRVWWLPRAGHDWFHLAPIAPVQGMAEPCGHAGGTLVLIYSKKGKMLHGREGSEKKARL